MTTSACLCENWLPRVKTESEAGPVITICALTAFLGESLANQPTTVGKVLGSIMTMYRHAVDALAVGAACHPHDPAILAVLITPLARGRAISDRRGYYRVPRSTSEKIMSEQGHEAHSLYCCLLSRARYEPSTIATKFGLIDLKHGQALISLRTLSQELKIERTKIGRCLDKWARQGLISLEPSRAVDAQSGEQLAAHRNAPFPTVVTINDYDLYTQSPPRSAQSNAHTARSSRTKTTPEGEEKTRKRRTRKASPSITERQYIFLANRISDWQGDYGGLYAGGGEESYERAFEQRFGISKAYWDRLRQQFGAEAEEGHDHLKPTT